MSNFRFIGSLRRAAIVDFDQANAGAVVQSREQRGVKARRQRRRYARLEMGLSAPDPRR